jgi:cytochrome c1
MAFARSRRQVGAMNSARRSILAFVSALSLAGALAATPAFAADKTYQVTGPVLEVTDAAITIQKGKEKWQIARTKDTKVTGDLKVGAKVTITYTMTATTVEAKADGKADKPAK